MPIDAMLRPGDRVLLQSGPARVLSVTKAGAMVKPEAGGRLVMICAETPRLNDSGSGAQAATPSRRGVGDDSRTGVRLEANPI